MEVKTYKFPTVHREAQFHEEPVSVEFDGEKWVVGEQALKHRRGCYYLRDVAELVHYYPLYLKQVKRREGIKKDRLKAVVSLPLDVYVVEKRKRESGIKDNLIDRLQFNCSAYGFTVEVVPQGIAGLQHLLNEGKIEEVFTLLIDGGFNTVNTAVVNPELGVDYFKTFTDEIGVRNLIEDFFSEELRKNYPGVSTNLVVLKEIFLKGVVDTGLKVEDIRPEKEKALERYRNRLFRRILGELRRAEIDYDQIVFMGGLSYYLSAEDFETNKKLFIPEEEGEFLNVRGLFDFAEGGPEIALDLGFGDAKAAVIKGEKNAE